VEESKKMPDIKSSQMQLGCGTLIIIALIVLFFSGGTKVNDLERSVEQLTKQVIVLQQKVDALSQVIKKQQQ
jgi:hypothetical protein